MSHVPYDSVRRSFCFWSNRIETKLLIFELERKCKLTLGVRGRETIFVYNFSAPSSHQHQCRWFEVQKESQTLLSLMLFFSLVSHWCNLLFMLLLIVHPIHDSDHIYVCYSFIYIYTLALIQERGRAREREREKKLRKSGYIACIHWQLLKGYLWFVSLMADKHIQSMLWYWKKIS